MQERKKNAHPDNGQTQSIFNRENGPGSGEELQQDETFRAFFTSTVIEVPEDMRHITGGVLLEEEATTEKEKKKGRWPWSRRKNTEADETDEMDAEDVEEQEASAESMETDDSFAVDLEEEEAEPAEKEETPMQDFATSFLTEEEPEQESEEVLPSKPVQQKAEPMAILPQKPQPEPAPKAEEKAELTANEFMQRTAEQAISVDELLSRISDLEAEESASAAAPKAEAKEPEETPELRRLREQTAAAAAGKSRLDAMLADIYAHATDTEPASSMQLVDEAEEEPAQPVSLPEEDTEQNTVEIALNLEEKPEPEVAAEAPELTGEISLLEEQPEETTKQAEPTDEADEMETCLCQEEPAPEEQMEDEEQTGEIRLDDDLEEDPEDTKEIVMDHPVSEADDVDDAEEQDDLTEQDTAEIPEETAGKRHGFSQMLQMLGLDESDEDDEYFAGTSGEMEEPEDSEEEEEKPRKGFFASLFHREENEDESDAEDAESEEKTEQAADDEEPLPVEEYNDPEDAPRVQEMLQKRRGKLTLFATISGILAVALLVMDLLGQYGKGIVTGIDPVAAPATWLCVNLILLAVCALLDGPALLRGVQSILPGQRPTVDGLSALAVFGAMLQLMLTLIFLDSFDPAKQTIFAGTAALTVFMDLLGKRMSATADRDGFASMTSGVDHATAYRLEDRALAQVLSQGLEEDDPAILLSRPDTILKGFVAQSAEPHHCDNRAVLLTRVLGGAALAGMVIDLVRGGSAITAGTVLAGILCLGAPLGILVLQGVSTLMMQRSANRVGAVIPGWPAIEKLGEVDVLQVDASELFPPMCAYLDGIKTFQKERIDSAILYATSVLIAGCNTLGGLFRGMIENNTDMLYPVKDLERRVGRGYVAWCDHCRVVLGTREMMQEEGIPLPALDYENRYSKNGSSHVLYLAVSGKLYAMFLFGYNGTRQVAHTLNILRKENIRLLITAQDPTLTEKRIEDVYRLEPGFIKVLNGEEIRRLDPAVGYLPSQVGCMAHLDGFASMVGGLCAAAGAEEAQRSSSVVQMVSTVLSVVIGLLLSITGGLQTISLVAVLLYQLAWAVLSIAVVMTKKY